MTDLPDHADDPVSRLPGDDAIDDDKEEEGGGGFIYNITSYGADFTVDGIVRRLRDNAYYIPPFQRNYVWKLSDASRFIESLLMGLPVPGIFLAKETRTGKHLVIDGQQRLKTLQFFLDGTFNERPFRLRNVSERWINKTFDDLDERDRLVLEDSIIHATVFQQIQPDDNDTSMYEIFERLNNGGKILTPQEVRRCLYYGPIMEFLDRCNDEPAWRDIYGKKNIYLKDQELILRFCAFFLEEEEYKGPMKTFLNRFASRNRYAREPTTDEWYRSFSGAMQTIRDAVGNRPFRLDRNLNAAVYEAVTVGLARRLRNGLRPDACAVRRAYEELLANDEFRAACEAATAGAGKVTTRQRLATEAFASI